MKKKSLAALFLLLILVLAFSACGQQPSSEVELDPTQPYSGYPDAETLEGISGTAEKLEACNIPEETLANLTTSALVESIFQNPMRSTYFNTNWVGGKVMLDWMERSFNAIPELYSREDGIAELESWLQGVEALSEKELEEKGYTETDISIAESLLKKMQRETSTPDAGTDTPDASTDTPDASTDTPDVSTDTPDVSTDTPDASTEAPETL